MLEKIIGEIVSKLTSCVSSNTQSIKELRRIVKKQGKQIQKLQKKNNA